jgi:peptide/nickel transport system permease protein
MKPAIARRQPGRIRSPLSGDCTRAAASTGAAGWLLSAWIAWALFGLVWTPFDPQAQAFMEARLAGPAAGHWLGVDGLGRDVLSRVWCGSGWTVLLGGAAAAGALLAAAGMLALERRGPVAGRALLRSLAAAGLAMPVMLVGFVLLVFLPKSAWTLVLACAIGAAPFAFRQLRVLWGEQAGALHVLASRALGATRWHVGWFSIWPNLRPQAAALVRLLFAMSVLELSGLSFLGLTGDPDLPELGAILRQNQAEFFRQPWLVIWPGVLLSGLLLVVHVSNVRGAGLKR